MLEGICMMYIILMPMFLIGVIAIPIMFLIDRIWNGKTKENASFKKWLSKF